jgi:hypothetical protein
LPGPEVQALLDEAERIIPEGSYEALRDLLARIQGAPNNIQDNLRSAAACEPPPPPPPACLARLAAAATAVFNFAHCCQFTHHSWARRPHPAQSTAEFDRPHRLHRTCSAA